MTSKLEKSAFETGTTEADYLRIALAMQGISSNEEICDRVIATYKKLNELGGRFSVRDAVDIKCSMDRKYAEKIAVKAEKNEGGKQ